MATPPSTTVIRVAKHANALQHQLFILHRTLTLQVLKMPFIAQCRRVSLGVKLVVVPSSKTRTETYFQETHGRVGILSARNGLLHLLGVDQKLAR